MFTHPATPHRMSYPPSDLFDPLFDRAQRLLAEGMPVPIVRVVLDCSQTKREDGESADALALRVAKLFCKTCWGRDTVIPEIYYYKPSAERNAKGWAMFSMHAKCIVVDGEIALVGSANFSDRARDRNLEVGALIRDHHFVQSLLAVWEDVEGELAVVPGEELRAVIWSEG
ncbi:phospholipase D-like domain-containing protein [Enhygromyxa salina]|uniref:phospholipase D n=1 Tax=Enhygromyxa salina TaxID=215803 RepID=A0A2S9YAD7_9BACT|nr:phospholipase D-like domain-containing protein [Enhygromyxa salina]PRQ02078.1 cardiolipin synthetase [Enhygromyxa salina]